MSTAPGLPKIFADSVVDLVPSRQIVDFPTNTFLESIAIDTNGTIFFTSHLEGKIFRLEKEGVLSVHGSIDGKATGLVLTNDGNLLMSGWDRDNIPTVYLVSPQGEVTVLVTMPDAMFLNGLTPLTENRYLVADSYKGIIWELNTVAKNYQVWLEHPDLARSSSNQEFPAVNGLKIYGNTLYASNTEKMQLVKIPLQLNGQPGQPEIFLQPVNLDDFAFDRDGNLYGTTHIYNSVVKITPSGLITIIAEAEQGMTGCTALAFGRGEGDLMSIYVVTNGGMSFPPPTGLEPSKVVRLDVAIQGHPLINR
jgi:sugar lactone lactonase YvrE